MKFNVGDRVKVTKTPSAWTDQEGEVISNIGPVASDGALTGSGGLDALFVKLDNGDLAAVTAAEVESLTVAVAA